VLNIRRQSVISLSAIHCLFFFPSSRLRFDAMNGNNQPYGRLNYADRVLADSSDQVMYQSSSYKDTFLRQYQSVDFEQRTMLVYLRATILNCLHALYVDSLSTTSTAILMPSEHMYQALTTINNDLEQCKTSLTIRPTISQCELQSIMELELYQSIPMFIQVLLNGLTWSRPAEATASLPVLTSSNMNLHFDRIDQHMNDISMQLERSFELVRHMLDKTSFQKRCDVNSAVIDGKHSFIEDFSGYQSALEIYSVYTEFISYTYSFYLAMRMILANLFNKTMLLNDSGDNTDTRSTTTKKTKKKKADQQAALSSAAGKDNDDEIKLWKQMEKIECIFDDQWTHIITNIHKYELWLRHESQLSDDECDRMEKDLDINADIQTQTVKYVY
jgi:hypothetical protein